VSLKEARSKLELARSQLKRVHDAVTIEDPEEAVTWAFYAYENAVVAAAEKERMPWKKTHISKQDVAEKLHRRRVLSRDVSDTLRDLNELRKDVVYGEVGEDLEAVDLEDLEIELEQFIDEVAELIEGRGK
jgi:uncharacterized protein YutE (UPF0331/DUF86 family)